MSMVGHRFKLYSFIKILTLDIDFFYIKKDINKVYFYTFNNQRYVNGILFNGTIF